MTPNHLIAEAHQAADEQRRYITENLRLHAALDAQMAEMMRLRQGIREAVDMLDTAAGRDIAADVRIGEVVERLGALVGSEE